MCTLLHAHSGQSRRVSRWLHATLAATSQPSRPPTHLLAACLLRTPRRGLPPCGRRSAFIVAAARPADSLVCHRLNAGTAVAPGARHARQAKQAGQGGCCSVLASHHSIKTSCSCLCEAGLPLQRGDLLAACLPARGKPTKLASNHISVGPQLRRNERAAGCTPEATALFRTRARGTWVPVAACLPVAAASLAIWCSPAD